MKIQIDSEILRIDSELLCIGESIFFFFNYLYKICIVVNIIWDFIH